MKFSERYGYTPVRAVLQTDGMDDGLRNRLWNIVASTYFPDQPRHATFSGIDYLPGQPKVLTVLQVVWHHHFKRPLDTIGDSYTHALGDFRGDFFGRTWYEVYDLIQFLAEFNPVPNVRDEFIEATNDVLKQELSGFRFVSDQIIQITSEEEISTIEQALAVPDSLKPVRGHLRQSLTLLADKKNPDYRNSIKEAISAVESMSKIVAKLPKTTLGPALTAIEKKTALHSSLKKAFHELYGYTSDAQGIRHALMDEPNLDLEDAKFMLVSCSAFINYLVVKAQKAGIAV
jgi:hypothetical protein